MPVHVAILRRPYLDMLLTGRKTVESRLTFRPLPPFRTIAPNERIYFRESCGPYRARARAAAVEFHDTLTPQRVAALQTKWNSAVCGEPAYWDAKKFSRVATFITLADVQSIHAGPRMPPSSGLAWFTLPDDADPDPVQAATPAHSTLTAGALRNRYVFWPREALPMPQGDVVLHFPDNHEVTTHVLTNGRIQWRRWGGYFRRAPLQPGDQVRFVPLGGARYRVEFSTQGPRHDATPSSKNASS